MGHNFAKVLLILCPVALFAQQLETMTRADSDGSKMTISLADGAKIVMKDGTTSEMSPARLNDYCSNPKKYASTLDEADWAALNDICTDWNSLQSRRGAVQQKDQTDEDFKNMPAEVYQPPAVLPDGCSAIVVSNMRSGTSAYVLLDREIEALKLGHKASQQAIAALAVSHSRNVNDFHSTVTLINGLTDAKNSYLCASFLLGNDDVQGDEQKAAHLSMISVYNRMALMTVQALKKEREMTERPAYDRQSSIKDAEETAKIIQGGKAAQSDLADAIALSVELTLNTDDLNATKIEAVRITCAERRALLSDLLPVTRKGVPTDDFTKCAEFLRTFLNKPYKCKA